MELDKPDNAQAKDQPEEYMSQIESQVPPSCSAALNDQSQNLFLETEQQVSQPQRHRNPPQTISANNPGAAFDAILSEIRSETQCFQPPVEQSCNEFLDSSNQELNGEDSDLSTPTEELAYEEQLELSSGLVPGENQTEPFKSAETVAIAGEASQNSSEDSFACGALPIPITDQYPCFQVSEDGNRVKFVGVAINLPGPSQALNSAVKIGTFPEVEDLPGMTKATLPESAPKNIIQVPFSVTFMNETASSASKNTNEKQKRIDGHATIGSLSSNDSSNNGYTAGPRPSKKGASVGSVPLTSQPRGIHPFVIPTVKELPPAPINMQPREIIQENFRFLFAKNAENLSGLGRPPLMSIPGLQKSHFQSPVNPTLIPGEASHQNSWSQSQRTPRKSVVQHNAIGCHQSAALTPGNGVATGRVPVEFQPNLQRKPSHASSNYRRTPGSGKPRDFQASTSMVVPLPHSAARVYMTEGQQPLITPTSILCEDMHSLFQDTGQQQEKIGLQADLSNLRLDASASGGNENGPWGTGKLGNKRKVCDVGSTYQTPAKKSRSIPSHVVTPKRQGEGLVGSSCTPGSTQTRLMQSESPNIPTSDCRTVATRNDISIAQVPQQNFVAGTQNLQGEVPSPFTSGQAGPSNYRGQQSEATISSPSKKRSIYVRKENDALPKRFVCKDCSEVFAFKENCERHLKVIHQGRTVYYCYHCPASYLQSKTLRCHVYKKHHVMNGDNSVFPCYWCEFKTSTEEAWTRHVAEEHPTHKNIFRKNM